MSRVLRTPDERFENLPDYPFSPNYVDISGYRIHYVDEGPRESSPVLMLHGEPSWSYLYRKMIPPIVNAGYRAVAPDFLGFGKSDKPVERADYTHQKHVDILGNLIEFLDLTEITMFCQDWGGFIGLRTLAQHPDRFSRVVVSNTTLPSARGFMAWLAQSIFKRRIRKRMRKWQDQPLDSILTGKNVFEKWVVFSQSVTVLPIGEIIQLATFSLLPDDVMTAYDAPFPDETYKAGARVFPMLVPSELGKNQRAWDRVLSKWEKPFLTAFADSDPIMRGFDKQFQKRIPGSKGQNHTIVKEAGHFIQEDKGVELAGIIIEFIKDNP